MKVYLLYSDYDDGQCYDSMSWNYLDKIVDSEEKAKKWIFEKAVEKCNKLTRYAKEWLDGGELHFDEDGPYYIPWTEEEIEEGGYKEELAFYLNQLDKLKFGDDRYVIEDFNGYEKYGFMYEVKEVE